MKTMTFSEMTTKTPNLYPTTIDDGLKEAIYEWFQFRHVVDDERFPVYFRRVLNRDYDRYNQLLRIQPGIAEYDWLVESYLERQVIAMGKTTGTSTVSNTGTNKVTRTNDSTTVDSTTGNRTVSDGGTERASMTESSTGTSGVSNGGKDTTKNTGTDTTTTTNTNVVDGEGTTSVRYTGEETNVRSGNEKHAREFSQDANAVTEKEYNKRQSRVTNTDTGNANAIKQGPMDAGVSSTSAIGGSGSVGGVTPYFDGHASQISQSIQAVTSEEYYTGSPDIETTTVSPYSYDDDTTITYNNVTDVKGFTNRSDSSSSTNDVTTTDNGSTSVAHGLQTETTYGQTSETEASTSGTRENVTTFGKTVTDNSVGNGTSKTTGTVVDEAETDGTSTGETNSENNNETRERLSGRHKEPAEILEKVVAFIQKTNAWEWLMPRLEVCFMGVYDI